MKHGPLDPYKLDPLPWFIRVGGMWCRVDGTPNTGDGRFIVGWFRPRRMHTRRQLMKESFRARLLGNRVALRERIAVRGQHEPWTDKARKERRRLGLR